MAYVYSRRGRRAGKWDLQSTTRPARLSFRVYFFEHVPFVILCFLSLTQQGNLQFYQTHATSRTQATYASNRLCLRFGIFPCVDISYLHTGENPNFHKI